MKRELILCKLCLVVLGLAVLSLVLHIHYESPLECKTEKYAIVVGYCPEYWRRSALMIVVSIMFPLSVISLAASKWLSSTVNKKLVSLDAVYHILALFLLLTSGGLYVGSVVDIDQLTIKWPSGVIQGNSDPARRKMLLYNEKLATGILSKFQVCIYAVTAFISTKIQNAKVRHPQMANGQDLSSMDLEK